MKINVNRATKASTKLESGLIDRIDTSVEDPYVKSKIQENEKISESTLPNKSERGFCTRCLIV